jgi:hypothetical protein
MFSALDDQSLEVVIDAMDTKIVASGEVVIN